MILNDEMQPLICGKHKQLVTWFNKMILRHMYFLTYFYADTNSLQKLMMRTSCAFTVTQPHYYPYSTLKPWKQHIYPCPLLATQFVLITSKRLRNGYGNTLHSDSPHVLIPVASSSLPPPSFSSLSTGVNDISTSASSSNQVLNANAAKGSGTTARGRRLLKVREEKRKREYDRVHNYPAWAKSVATPLC